jgi:hypothetical protein
MESSPAVEGGGDDQNPAGGSRPRCAGRRRAAVVLRRTSGDRERWNGFNSAGGCLRRPQFTPVGPQAGESGRRTLTTGGGLLCSIPAAAQGGAGCGAQGKQCRRTRPRPRLCRAGGRRGLARMPMRRRRPDALLSGGRAQMGPARPTAGPARSWVGPSGSAQ